MERDPLHDSVDRLLTERCTRKHVMDIEGGAPAGALWNALVELGLPDALVPEARGGAGLGLEDVTSVLLACGAHALPLPLAQTMVARAALASAGHEAPEGPIAISGEDLGEGVEIVCPRVPFGCTAEWVLVPSKGAALLLPVREASVRLTAIPRSLEADLRWEDHLGALRLEGEVRPAEFLEVRMNVEGKEIAFPTGRGGEFYLENIRPQKIALQLDYVRHHSFLIDLKILFKTAILLFK